MFEDCDDEVFDSLTLEMHFMLDASDDNGRLVQMYKAADGTVVRGSAPYAEVEDIPDAGWLCQGLAVLVSPNTPVPEDRISAVNDAVNRLNATEYYSIDEGYDFRREDEEAYIYQPQLETKEQRDRFFSALEDLRKVAPDTFTIGMSDEACFFDGGTEVRLMKFTMDKETGKIRYYMTRPVPRQ